MFDRRSFLATGIAAMGAPALAQSPEGWQVPEEYMPRIVRLRDEFPPGEIHVDPNAFKLFWTLEDRNAIQYTVGVGRGELYEWGEFWVAAKREWPSWRPTDEMIERDPASYKQYEDGMPGGPDNPLGARALYLFYPDTQRDSYLRIHGTPQPWTIGQAVSNGCARLVNSHMIDLYNRVEIGARVRLYSRGTA